LLRLSKKQKVLGLIFAAVFVVGIGVLIWAAVVGKIKIGAVEEYNQRIHGHIYDRQGQPLSGVKVTDLGSQNSVVSSSDGSYNITNLKVGDVVIRFEKDGKVYDPGFPDVPQNHWAYKWIGAAKNGKIVGGYPDGTFRPEDKLDRGQMAIFLSRALAKANGLSDVPQGPPDPHFPDIPLHHVAYKYIEYLYSQGVVSGYPDGLYHPENIVDRGQMAIFISKALKLDLYDKYEPTFPDVPKDHWAYKYVETVNLAGIAMGYPDGTYGPSNPMDRAQMTVFITRAFHNIKLTDGGYIPRIERFVITEGEGGEFDIYMTPCGEVGKIAGQAKLKTGAKVANAQVVITLEPSISEEYYAITNSSGDYQIFNIPACAYGYYIIKPDSTETYKTEYWENMVFVETGKINLLNLYNLE